MDKKKTVKKFFDDISFITKRPIPFHLTDVYGIQLAMYGYIMGRKSKVLTDFFTEFQTFINEEFAEDFTSKKIHGWTRLIWFYSSDGAHSIELFNSLFEKYFNLYLQKLDTP